ncbi:MAG: tetratricopeptide repeat protein [Phycisphaerae bacterium]
MKRLTNRSSWTAAALTAVVVLGAVQLSPAQVRQRNTGQALDSNYQVGSGGYNTVTGGNRGVNTQLDYGNRLVTGQVSGLARFRGQVGYDAADQLQVDVPSADLAGFRRQSVGLGDVLHGRTYDPGIYRDTSRTVLRLPEIRGGRTAADLANERRTLLTSDAGERLYRQSLEEYGTQVPPRGELLDTTPEIEQSTRGERYGTRLDKSLTARRVVSQPGSGALFGVARTRDRLELARELAESGLLGHEGSDVTRDTVEQRIEQSTRRPRALLDGNQGIDVSRSETGRDRYVLQKGQDIFLEVMANLAQARGEAEVQYLRTTVDRGKEQPRVEMDRREGVVIHSLAGSGRDLFNTNMRRAETKLAEGKFYDAAGRYELASIADPRNPLARVGMSLSLMGADEPLSAAWQLRKALRLFPGLVRTKVDVEALLGKERVASQLEQIDKRIERGVTDNDKSSLLMVKAFLARNTGRDKEARAAAKEMLELEIDGVDSKYARYILTGEWPRDGETRKSE